MPLFLTSATKASITFSTDDKGALFSDAKISVKYSTAARHRAIDLYTSWWCVY